jgi:hypothetical protein
MQPHLAMIKFFRPFLIFRVNHHLQIGLSKKFTDSIYIFQKENLNFVKHQMH